MLKSPLRALAVAVLLTGGSAMHSFARFSDPFADSFFGPSHRPFVRLRNTMLQIVEAGHHAMGAIQVKTDARDGKEAIEVSIHGVVKADETPKITKSDNKIYIETANGKISIGAAPHTAGASQVIHVIAQTDVKHDEGSTGSHETSSSRSSFMRSVNGKIDFTNAEETQMKVHDRNGQKRVELVIRIPVITDNKIGMAQPKVSCIPYTQESPSVS